MTKALHIAALALMGWYLIMPPKLKGADLWPPLSQWFLVKTFDSEKDCKTAQKAEHDKGMDAVMKKYRKWLDGRPSSPATTREFSHEHYALIAADVPRTAAQCIASDDPRLK